MQHKGKFFLEETKKKKCLLSPELKPFRSYVTEEHSTGK